MQDYTLVRYDEETGEETVIELEVEVDFYPGCSVPSRFAIDDSDVARVEIGLIVRADNGEVFEPTGAELDEIIREMWERLDAAREER